MLASLAHQSWSRQLLLPCFFAKQIPTMLHEHFDDTLLFSRVEIFCSSTKRGQNLDCRDWKSDLQNPAVEKGVMWHVSIAPACDVHQFFAPSSTLDGFDISSVIRHQPSPSSRGCCEAGWGCLISALTSTILKRGSTTLRSMLPFSEIEYRQSGRRRRPLASEAAEADCHFRL